MGITEPQATFSPCFGGPFLVWHPSFRENFRTYEAGASIEVKAAGPA